LTASQCQSACERRSCGEANFLQSAPNEQHHRTRNQQGYPQHIPSIKQREYDSNSAACCARMHRRADSRNDGPCWAALNPTKRLTPLCGILCFSGRLVRRPPRAGFGSSQPDNWLPTRTLDWHQSDTHNVDGTVTASGQRTRKFEQQCYTSRKSSSAKCGHRIGPLRII
jgi:hypothetical protein